MNRIMRRVVGVVATAALAPILLSATAQADPGPVYFSVGSINCAIAADGTVGCDFGYPTRLQYSFLPFPFSVNDIVIDQPWLPAHPTFGSGAAFTLPDGNPSLDSVKTGSGQWGPFIEYAGSRCAAGFHGSFGCQSKGRAFTAYSGTISA
ncbi:hypothetical protein AB0C34_22300 [Nocardia sp. NPDC049220]|uniref:hypothetical protein n=1 Tax=Nocardia sp. NPDC049220 TaxID=3155273 RepID=UPI0033DC4C73